MMIFDSLGLALNVITIGVTSLLVAIFLLSALTAFGLNYLTSFSAGIRARLLWAIVILPWIIAVASIFLLLAPELFQFRLNWLSSFIHWHHAAIFHIFSWHGALLLVFCITFLLVSITKLSSAVRSSSQLSQLDYFSVSDELGSGMLLVHSDTPQAFTAGLFNPRSYITHGLRDKLSEESLAIVQQHELAHKRRRDPLRIYVFSLLVSFFAKTIGKRLNDAFSLALEQLADQSALRSVRDKTSVSRTILDVARLNNQECGTAGLSAVNCGFTSNALQLRIRYLLDGEPPKAFPYFKLVISTLVMITVCTLSVDFIHHSVETLFSH